MLPTFIITIQNGFLMYRLFVPLLMAGLLAGCVSATETDSDGDGIVNEQDAFPYDARESVDSDGDGVGDNSDAFPNDSEETLDSDTDGVGNNADTFPTDASESMDSDGDGIGDNSDAFPSDPEETLDSDTDGIGNNADAFPTDAGETTDSDGDGIGDNSDAFPSDSEETLDSDKDGVGDNADAFPADITETIDSDGDGTGDNSDAFPNDSEETLDSDTDGTGDNADAFPNDATETMDSDSDGVGDNSDTFPNDASETVDSDGDGTGDNADTYPNDFDNDSVPDAEDAFPRDSSESIDSDGDGVGDNSDAFPNDPSETQDSDGDGIGDNSDPNPNENTSEVSAVVYPVFNPITGQLPLGIDLIFASAASSDGTANTGAEGTAYENAVTNAIDDLDGGISTIAAIDIAMSGSIDPATVIAGSTVHLVKLPNASDITDYDLTLPYGISAADIDALDLTTLAEFFAITLPDGSAPTTAEETLETVVYKNFPSLMAMQPVAGTDYEVSVIDLDDGEDNTVRISPLKPLDAKCKYIVLLTGGIQSPATATSFSEAIQASDSYTYISGTDTLFNGSLADVRASVNAWEALAGVIISAGGSDVEALAGGIALTSAFTTVDPHIVLKSMAYPGVWAASAVVGNNETVAASILAGAVAQGALDQAMVDAVTAGGLAIPTAADVVSGFLTSDAGAGIAYEHPRSRSTALISNTGGAGVNQIPATSLSTALSAKVLVSQAGIELPQYTVALATDSNGQWEGSTGVGGVLDALSGNAAGTTPPSDIDGDKNVTYRFPFAAEQRKAVVPILLIEPTTIAKATVFAAVDGIEGTTAAVYDSGCAKPENGWETIILQHGFIADRATTLAVATILTANTCHAVIAMDLPHHGIAPVAKDRNGVAIDNFLLGLGVDYTNATTPTLTPFAAAVDAIVAADPDSLLANLVERHEGLTASGLLQFEPMTYGGVDSIDNPANGTSGEFFIRLDVLQRTRDNLRQSVMDLLNLNASITTIDVDGDGVPDLDKDNVHFVGHSLGAIVGATFVAVNNDATVLAGNPNLNQIKSATLAAPGGALSKLLENSVSFGAAIVPRLAAQDLTQGSSNLEAFLSVFQATIDTADPANFIESLAADKNSATPTMIFEMVGGGAIAATDADYDQDSTADADGNGDNVDSYLSDSLLALGVYPSDLIVPNNAIGSLMADGSTRSETSENTMTGTDKLVELLGSTSIDSAGMQVTSYPVAKFQEGTHETFSSADAMAAFTEMMTEVITFITSDGTAAMVVNDSVIK